MHVSLPGLHALLDVLHCGCHHRCVHTVHDRLVTRSVTFPRCSEACLFTACMHTFPACPHFMQCTALTRSIPSLAPCMHVHHSSSCTSVRSLHVVYCTHLLSSTSTMHAGCTSAIRSAIRLLSGVSSVGAAGKKAETTSERRGRTRSIFSVCLMRVALNKVGPY